MRLINKTFFIRNIDADDLFESFLVASVVAILSIRTFLYFFSYPIIGRGQLHVAHMLWGGLLMFMAIAILLSFSTKSTERVAAIVGGLGFGTFIDEIGKFLTIDNNYFFKPSTAIIYAILMLIFVYMKVLAKHRKYSEPEYMVNGMDFLKESVINDLDVDEKAKAVNYFTKAKHIMPFSKVFLKAINDLEAMPKPSPTVYANIRTSLKKLYFVLVSKKWFILAIQVFFIFQLFLTLYHIGILLLGFAVYMFPAAITVRMVDKSIFDSVQLLGSVAAGSFAVIGVLKMRKSRLHAYFSFKKYTLINLLVVQVLYFYENSLMAISFFVLNFFIYAALNYLIYTEEFNQSELKMTAALEPKDLREFQNFIAAQQSN